MLCRSRSEYRRGEFFGVDTKGLSPGAQVVMSLSVLAPVALGIAAVLVFFGQMFWLVFTFGWIIFPALGLLTEGLANLSESPSKKQVALDSSANREKELLRALQDFGELTASQAALETSLSVAEAEQRLKELAEDGHLEVRGRGGGLFYALWEFGGEKQVVRGYKD